MMTMQRLPRERMHDGARQRYATRRLDPDGLHAGFVEYYDEGRLWSDYDGDSLYGDFEIQSGQGGHTIERSSYEPGLGRFGWTSSQPDYTTERYYHSDHLGSVRGTTNFFSTWVEPMAYTAFGERITGTQNSYMTRVGYVGAHGYQSTPIFETTPHADIGYLHLGHRYYDPASGRFLQRDPIGIRGGSNVYAYARNLPTILVDPSGLLTSIGNPKAIPVLIEVGALLGMDLVASTNVGLSIGVTAMACSSIWQRTPAHGRPNGSEAFDDGNGKGTNRDYGPDGRAIRDYDFGHDHGAGDPHAHDWDWSQIPPRQPGRPLLPGE